MIKIAPSILSADFSRLGEDIQAVDRAGADYIHVDVMDGHFVPNITIGPLVVDALRGVTELPLDCHLMIEEPDRYVEAFAKAGAEMISVHVEVLPHLHRTVQVIKELGVKAGVALNPSTPLSAIHDMLADFAVTDLWWVVEESASAVELHFVRATESDYIVGADRERLLAASADSKRVYVHDVEGGHWLNMDNPEALIELLDTWLP